MNPKEDFSSVDVHAVAAELRSLGKAWMEKAYDLEGKGLLITLRTTERDKLKLVIVPGQYVALVSGDVGHLPEPSSFAQSIRKYLAGLPLEAVEQPGGERYLELSFSRSMEETPRVLVIELFGEGNALVVREGKIVAVATSKAWAHRVLRPGEEYVRPPSRRNPLSLTLNDISSVLGHSKTNLVTTLASRLSLGGPLAEEVVARAGLDPQAMAQLEPDRTAGPVLTALTSVLAEVGETPHGYLYFTGGSTTDVQPYPSFRWKDQPDVRVETLPTFSEAALRYFAEHPKVAKEKSAEEVERLRLERLRAQQMAGISALEGMAKELREAADAILSNYSEVEERVKKLLEQIPDEEEAEIEVQGKKVVIDPRKSPRQEATKLYDKAKKQLPKLEGAKRALGETEAALSGMGKKSTKRATAAATRLRPERKKHFWFEKAPRWFVASDGVPIVGGRDAKSNDGVVKRYLKESDYYIHADVHGAPSVVVKVPPGQEVSPKALEEAGAWSVSFSKAWRAAHASADAFWVRGDQVSKAGGSGEYVPVGSWVIHGTKQTMRDLPVALAIGEITFEGETLLVSAPPGAFGRAGSRVLWNLTPGDEKERSRVEKELSRELGVSLATVQSLLPGGGVRAERA